MVSYKLRNKEMAATRDWIPKQIDKFKIFADNLCKRTRDNAWAWHLVAGEVSRLRFFRPNYNRSFNLLIVRCISRCGVLLLSSRRDLTNKKLVDYSLSVPYGMTMRDGCFVGKSVLNKRITPSFFRCFKEAAQL